jgi:hypothetical protein
MDKLKQLESFVTVATKGSLTATALAEGVAPAVIGRRIDALEERLGVKLLVRTTRRITLTHEGSAFLEDCQRLLADLANAEASVSAGGVKASGHLRITAPAGFGRRHVAPQVPRFIALHPDVSVSLNLSDRVVDIVNEGFDCVFGSRFVRGGRVEDYPRVKLLLNRIANAFIRAMFAIPLNDTTNAFKAYRRTAIDGCRPFLSPHFNLTVEIPLKAIVRGYSWTTMPISWRNRRHGVAKLKIKEMGSRYFFICMYVWLEKYFSRGDYRKSAN